MEKYRPRALDEVAHHKEIVQALQNAVSTDRLPHLLLYGPPGTGMSICLVIILYHIISCDAYLIMILVPLF